LIPARDDRAKGFGAGGDVVDDEQVARRHHYPGDGQSFERSFRCRLPRLVADDRLAVRDFHGFAWQCKHSPRPGRLVGHLLVAEADEVVDFEVCAAGIAVIQQHRRPCRQGWVHPAETAVEPCTTERGSDVSYKQRHAYQKQVFYDFAAILQNRHELLLREPRNTEGTEACRELQIPGPERLGL